VLRDLREKSGVSQEAFALACRLHRTYISQLERGLKSPTLATIEKLAAELGVRPHQLIKAAGNRSRLGTREGLVV
jgi:transcriptional regulator with XRE-family HTH domain